jgi:hypothetical protein
MDIFNTIYFVNINNIFLDFYILYILYNKYIFNINYGEKTFNMVY